MKPTEFAKYLTEFLTTYLTGQMNVSKNTILSYRDTFKLLLRYCHVTRRIPPERITLEALTSELVTGFLDWLETERKCSISTRNQRLAAIHSFFRYAQGKTHQAFTISRRSYPSRSKRKKKSWWNT